jgi:hypothetical protein
MESFVRLSPAAGGSFGNDAIYAGSTFNDTGQANVIGSPPGSDNADIYSGDDLKLTGGGTVNGSVKTRKTLTLSGGTQVKKDAIALQGITMSGGSIVWGSASSSTSNIDISGGSTQVKRDASACAGSPPINTHNNSSAVLGQQYSPACPSPATPPAEPWPTYTYNSTDWTNVSPSYSVQGPYTSSSACTTAGAWIQNNLNDTTANAANNVVRIANGCTLKLNGGENVKLRGDLAIISDGSLDVSGNATFSSGDGRRHKLFLFFGLGGTSGCTNGISLSGGMTIDSNLDTLIYTPCTVKNTGGTLIATGQIYADNWVSVSGGTSLTFKGIIVPGLSTGYFKQDIAYIREVVN